MRVLLNCITWEKTGEYLPAYSEDYLKNWQELRDKLIGMGMTPLQIAIEVKKKEPYIEIVDDKMRRCSILWLNPNKVKEVCEIYGGEVCWNDILVPITYETISKSILPF